MRNDPSGSSEEPVRPVSPQVVTIHTCLDIMCTHMLAYKWFIVFCCLSMCTYVCICTHIYMYICIYVHVTMSK